MLVFKGSCISQCYAAVSNRIVENPPLGLFAIVSAMGRTYTGAIIPTMKYRRSTCASSARDKEADDDYLDSETSDVYMTSSSVGAEIYSARVWT